MQSQRLSSSVSPLCVSITISRPAITHQQVRHATLIRRPKRPYTFTQLVTLSDGSSYLQRTTSPEAVYKSTKDARNSAMWNPSSFKLTNIEEDEAGKLRRFRERFGRGWDVKTASSEETVSPRRERDWRQCKDMVYCSKMGTLKKDYTDNFIINLVTR